MDLLTWVQLALHAAAGALAVLLARRRVEHRPAAIFIVGVLLADIAKWVLILRITRPYREAFGLPYVGEARLAFHVDSAFAMLWPFGLAALSAAVFAPHFSRRAITWIAIVYAATSVALVVTYPEVRGVTRAWVYAATYLGAVLVVLTGLVTWWPRRAHPRPEHAVTLVLGVLELALFVGPFAPPLPDPVGQWPIARVVHLLSWGAVCALQGGAVWTGLMLSPSRRGHSQQLH